MEVTIKVDCEICNCNCAMVGDIRTGLVMCRDCFEIINDVT